MHAIDELMHEVDGGTVPDARRRELLLTATGIMGASDCWLQQSVCGQLQPRSLHGPWWPVSVDVSTLARVNFAPSPGAASRSG